MGDGLISQNEIDSILNSLGTSPAEGESGGGGGEIPSAGTIKMPAKVKESIDTENIPLLLDVKMKLSVVLGNTRASIRDVLDLGKGSVVELNRFVEDDVDVYINDQLIGKGIIVAIDDEYGVKITKILEPVKKIGFKK